jgi:AbrB family looped-hinge helix DNA binding protein
LYQVKVRRKGQVTLPTELRRKLKIQEGSILEADARQGVIVLKPIAPVEGGKVVGEEFHRKVMEDLGELRKRWR